MLHRSRSLTLFATLLSGWAIAAWAAPARADGPEGIAQVNVTGGVVFPGEMTPKQVFRTITGVGPIVRLEAGFAPIKRLELGPYLSISSHPVTEVKGFPQYDGSGSVFVASFGAMVKVRFEPIDGFTIRAGAYVGMNFTNGFIAHNSGGGEGIPGLGLSVGPLVDLRLRLIPHLAGLFQIGFLSQPVGTATFPKDTDRANEHVDFAYPPMLFLTLGPELYF